MSKSKIMSKSKKALGGDPEDTQRLEVRLTFERTSVVSDVETVRAPLSTTS